MFENLKPMPADPILGLMAAFRADNREQKIDLGVGVYQDDQGNTPIMEAVQLAEARLMDEEVTKAYQGIVGDADFNEQMMALVFGSDHAVLNNGRARSIQAPGGSGALRIGAEVLRRANPKARLWIGVPTWPNHIPLLGSAGITVEQYPYYDVEARSLNFDAMLETLSTVPTGDVVLLHGCCHNPTGADLSQEQWRQIAELAKTQGFIPFIDTAYQGLGDGIEEDAHGMRLMATEVPELVIATSCSKNFGLYRERTGSVIFVSSSPEQADIVASQAASVARQTYSMPPAHGALLVSMILRDERLRNDWQEELKEVRERIVLMRTLLADSIQENTADMDFSHIKQQKGMFSFLGITPEQLVCLREEFGIYIVDSTRINLAGINSNNIDYLVNSLKTVLR